MSLLTDPITLRAGDGRALFRVQPRPAFDEWRDGYMETALGFVGMHDGIAEALAERAAPQMPSLYELRPPEADAAPYDEEWDCFYDDEFEPEAAPVGRARRLLKWVMYG